MQKTAQTPAQASGPNAQLKAKIIADVEKLAKRDPGQAQNAASVKALLGDPKGGVPNHKTPVLYAIGGKAGLVTVAQYGTLLRNNSTTKAKSYCFSVCGSMMAGAKPPPATPAAPAIQAQLAASAHFGRSQSVFYAHEILVEFRCPGYAGGDEKVTRIAATLNDTGSNVQSIRQSHWDAIKAPGMAPTSAQIDTAAGPAEIQNVWLEVRVVAPEYKKNAQGQKVLTGKHEPLTVWYLEMLRVVNDSDTLLSGAMMRNYLYFATAPGNDQLFVSQRKNGIVTSLPVEASVA